MYRYDEFDERFVRERVTRFGDQIRRRLNGQLSEEEFRPLRLMNGVYLQLHAYMLRVAIPYGVLSAEQMRVLAGIAERFDRGYGHFTTRQNIQFNWPRLVDMPALLERLADVQMHAVQTSGNCIRNITCDPLAGVAADELADPRPTAELLRQWSTGHPEFSYLPRKFKIAITGAATDRAAILFHDIGIRLVEGDDGEVAYRIIVGGGQGRTPVIGELLREQLPRVELLGYLEAVMRVYNRHGRRDNKYKARIKILVRDLGIARFRTEVEAEYATVPMVSRALGRDELRRIERYFETSPAVAPGTTEPAEHRSELAASPAFVRWRRNNTAAHKVSGYTAVTITLKSAARDPGDASSAQMRALADLAERYSNNELRITYEQNVVLPHVPTDELEALWEALTEHDLGDGNHGLIGDVIACPGQDYCSLATARSLPVAKEIGERFADPQAQQDIGPLSVKISGCINACGHHHAGHIGILGLEKAGREFYQLTLGGDAGNDARIGERTGPGFAADEISDAVGRVVAHYKRSRGAGETFLQTYQRLGAQSFKEALYAARS